MSSDEKTLLTGIATSFAGFGVFDWIRLGFALIRLLAEFLESDGNGGLKLKSDEYKEPR